MGSGPKRPQKFERADTRNARRLAAGDSAQPTWRKMLMNRLVVAALILSPLVARAWEPLQGALSLDFGGCWIRQETREPRWKIVSFGDRVASNYGANEFQQLLDPSITTILRSAFE